ncbi:MAG: pentapeptide repeat-containing protein [Anaerolineales bacterium]|nr:pentapeptide repeat-containing protein [Anaerolineales bacterium]
MSKSKNQSDFICQKQLGGADFTGAVVKKCDFAGADLTNSKWKRVKQVEGYIWKDVKGGNPDNFPPELWKEIQNQNPKPIKKRSTK